MLKRYNKPGEWKPIIYPGDKDSILKDVRRLSEDKEVQGVLFYMMCTGCRVIEFVVRATVELPEGGISFDDKFYLWKCPPLDNTSKLIQSICIYDGWLGLESTDPEEIRLAIAMIGVTVNRLAFAYNATANWRLKYTIASDIDPYATPSKEDVQFLDSIFRSFPRTDDAILLDAAIDWYNRGRSSRNIFTAYLCYYIAFESVAIAVADGKADLGLNYLRESKKSRKQKLIDDIQLKHDSLYPKDPVRFIREAYFDCILSLKEKTYRVAELVFGPEHRFLTALFQKRDGYSLNDIRGKLAHGGIKLFDKEDENLVRNRLQEIADISREFLTRIIFLLKPTNPLPSWSQLYRLSFTTADPRTTLVVSREDVIPNKDWRIRPEWCD